MALDIYSFVRLPINFFNTIGVTAFHQNINGQTSTRKWKTILLLAAFLNLGLCFLGEIINLSIAFRDMVNFVKTIEIVLCIGFILLAFVKIGTIVYHKSTFTWLMGELAKLFPRTMMEHVAFRTDFYVKKTRDLMRLYAWILMIMIWLFNFYPMIQAFFNRFAKEGQWRLEFPYPVWYPFNPNVSGLFEVVYASQLWAAYTAAASMLAADLLLCGVAIQVCMQFDHLAERLRRMRPRGGEWANEEFAQLKECVQIHIKLIRFQFN